MFGYLCDIITNFWMVGYLCWHRLFSFDRVWDCQCGEINFYAWLHIFGHLISNLSDNLFCFLIIWFYKAGVIFPCNNKFNMELEIRDLFFPKQCKSLEVWRTRLIIIIHMLLLFMYLSLSYYLCIYHYQGCNIPTFSRFGSRSTSE